MVLTILFWVFTSLFLLKIVWNISKPLSLALELLRSGKDKTNGVTFMPFVEFWLLVIVVSISVLKPGLYWFQEPLVVAFLGGVIIIGSYLFFIIFGFSRGWLIAKLRAKSK